MLYELCERTRILLIGADGQLGWELRRTASPLGDVFATVENDSGAATCPRTCWTSPIMAPSGGSWKR